MNNKLRRLVILFPVLILSLLMYITSDFHNGTDQIIMDDQKEIAIQNELKPDQDTITENFVEKKTDFDKTILKEDITFFINNLFNEPIAHGTLKIDNREYQFNNGCLRLDRTDSKKFTIDIRADGYQPISHTIDKREENEFYFNLDYFFDILVKISPSDLSNNSDENITLNLYESKLCQRPIKNTMQVFYNYQFSMVEYLDNQLYLRETPGIHKTSNAYIDPNKCILSVDHCFWSSLSYDQYIQQKGTSESILPNISKPKMYDLLSICCLEKPLIGKKMKSFYKTMSTVKESDIFLPDFNDNCRLINTFVINKQGEYHIRDLKPGLYFVQARNSTINSDIIPIHPVVESVKIPMTAKNGITIFTKLGGIQNDYSLLKEKVSDVKVDLKLESNSGFSLFSAITKSNGKARFTDIPKGTYTITATPSEKSGLKPIYKTIKITRPNQICTLYFNDWGKGCIRGRVEHFLTGKRIEGIELTLHEGSSAGFLPCHTTQSDLNGEFSFDNLPDGMYKLFCYPNQLAKKEYYPYKEEIIEGEEKHLQPFIFSNDRNKYTYTSILNNSNSDEIVVKVAPIKKTFFRGRVIFSDGEPAKGAFLNFIFNPDEKLDFNLFLNGDLVTNDLGKFEFYIYTFDVEKKNTQKYESKVIAHIGELNENMTSSYLINDELRVTTINQVNKNFEYIGESNIAYKPGDTINDLIIRIECDSLLTFEGHVRTEDGHIPKINELFVLQDFEYLYGKYHRDGSFIVNGIKNLPFRLTIRNAYSDTTNATQDKEFYLDESIFFDQPRVDQLFEAKNEPGLNSNIEVILKKSGWLKGKILYKDGSPCSNACIKTDPNIGQAIWTITAVDGSFTINKLKKGTEYPLYLSKDDEFNSLLLFEALTPNIDNIIITVEKQ